MKTAITQNAKLLAIFAIACTLFVGLIHLVTKDKIAKQAELHLLKTLYTVIDADKINNDLYADCLFINDSLLGNDIEQTAYLGRLDNTPVAAALTVSAPDGYNGRIDLLVAMTIDGTITGVRTLKHNETPGLGDKIELRKDNWITSFNQQIVEDENDTRWGVKKDGGMFDQFTGATITPRAVVKAVKNAALYFQQNQTKLFNETASCRGTE